MEAVILAGGFGIRLNQIVTDLPKPMAPVAGRPFLEILLSMLARRGFTRIVLSLGFMSEKIINHFGDRYLGMNLIYEVENFPLGTGGAIRVALKNCLADHAFIFNGDTYLDLEVDDLELIWQRNHNPLIVLREVSDTSRFGKVNLDSGRVTDFLEKGIPGPGLINAGCYVLPKNGLDEFPLGQIFSIETDFFNKYLKLIRFDGFVTKGQFIDIGVPKDYFLAQNVLAGL